MSNQNLDIEKLVNFEHLAKIDGISVQEAVRRWNDNLIAYPVGAVKICCTGRNTHKSAFIGWLRVFVFKDGEYAIGMSETGNATNIQNSKGLQDAKRMQGNHWPFRDDDGSYVEGLSGSSYRFFCGRCRRDFQILPEKLGRAAQAMFVNGYKYLDLSTLPFG